jgi:SAM-dependent methyltransferase
VTDTRASYDRVATEYAARIYGELAGKPLDRELLTHFGRAASGPVCDLGCGPGQIARFLRDGGVKGVFGIDLSPGMLDEARRLNPDIDFACGDMLRLPVRDASLGGVAAFYSILHVPRERVVEALREVRRVLRPQGLLLLSFHLGARILHLDEWWGKPVSLDFLFFEVDEMVAYVTAAGLEVAGVTERDPYPEVEHESRRAYVLALR